MTVDASVVVDFGTDPQDRRYAFSAAVDTRDAAEQLPVAYHPVWFTYADYGKEPGIYYKEMALVRYGYATFRLYCPASFSPVTVVTLDPITETPVGRNFTFGNSIYWVYDSGYSGNQIVYLGRFTDTITEEVTFNNSGSEEIKYWYDNPTITILSKSIFVNKLGQTIADPVYRGNGVYTLSEPGYGSLFITYQASFFKYRVFYHMPDNKYYYEVLEAENKLQWLTNRKELPFRDLTVVCSYQSYQTTVSLNRELMDWNFNNSAGIDGESLGEFTGGAEKTQGDCTVRYTDPADATAYIDVKYYKKYFFKDSNGRTLTLLFPNCT